MYSSGSVLVVLGEPPRCVRVTAGTHGQARANLTRVAEVAAIGTKTRVRPGRRRSRATRGVLSRPAACRYPPRVADVLTADDARHWALLTRAAFAARRAEIDALNVFPVPDGDTGTNLYLTMDSAIDATVAAHDEAGILGTATLVQECRTCPGRCCWRRGATRASSSASSSGGCAQVVVDDDADAIDAGLLAPDARPRRPSWPGPASPTPGGHDPHRRRRGGARRAARPPSAAATSARSPVPRSAAAVRGAGPDPRAAAGPRPGRCRRRGGRRLRPHARGPAPGRVRLVARGRRGLAGGGRALRRRDGWHVPATAVPAAAEDAARHAAPEPPSPRGRHTR